ncbi:TPA: hypothetical protein ACGA34_000284 [Clostridium perfringens]
MRQSMLTPWLKGNESITPRNFYMENKPNFELGAFLGIDEYIDLYKVYEFDSGNLEDSWLKTHEYIDRAFSIINEDLYRLLENNEIDMSLDNEEKYMILKELGNPPLCSYNIYIITIYNDKEERIVYIGKTDSKKSRFKNGHLAALKLHNPKYEGYKKRIYFGTIVFLSESNFIPLEYITPLEYARTLLSYTESILIKNFKPELNTLLIDSNIDIPKIQFHIQNFTDTSPFLNDIFIS